MPQRFILLSALCVWCSNWSDLAYAQDRPTATEQQSASRINVDALRAHIRFLADDRLQGRGPGSVGDELAQKYIVAKLESLGFQPAAPDGGYLQSVPLIGVKTNAPDTVTFRSGAKSLTLDRDQDYVMTSGRPRSRTGFEASELVFVGYGMVAPEYDWDDFKDVDVSGKVLLIMNNDPADDPELFAGNRRLYYGRWDYKYDMAARKGAAGAIIIHTTASAGYPYGVVQTSWNGVQFELADQEKPRTEMNGWLTESATRELVELSGHNLDQLRSSAEKRDFRPVALNTTLALSLRCEIQKSETANVIAKLAGSDPQLADESVVFMAHHDHIGMAIARDETGDNIYNGAVDNASGVAALLCIADACASMPTRPKRSLLFSTVGAEEQGLLGSKHFASQPPVPAGYLAAVINIDGLGILGRTHDVNVIGLGKSTMDDHVRSIANWQRRVVVPDQFPDRGYYYRSDQFSLAQVGVPGVYLHPGIQVRNRPDGWGRARREEWVRTNYHQTSDEYSEDWDLSGAAEDVQFLYHVGIRAANAAEMPRWLPGDEFESARKQAISERE